MPSCARRRRGQAPRGWRELEQVRENSFCITYIGLHAQRTSHPACSAAIAAPYALVGVVSRCASPRVVRRGSIGATRSRFSHGLFPRIVTSAFRPTHGFLRGAHSRRPALIGCARPARLHALLAFPAPNTSVRSQIHADAPPLRVPGRLGARWHGSCVFPPRRLVAPGLARQQRTRPGERSSGADRMSGFPIGRKRYAGHADSTSRVRRRGQDNASARPGRAGCRPPSEERKAHDTRVQPGSDSARTSNGYRL